MLEERREGLERYMQCLASVDPPPRELIDFLGLPDVKEQRDNVTTQVFGYKKDPFKTNVGADRDTDMITAVTVNTFYDL